MYLLPFAFELTKRRSWWKPLLEKILNDWMVRSKRAYFSSSLWNPPILAFYLGLFPSVSNNYTPTPSPTGLPRSKLEVFFSAFFSGASGTNCGARVWIDTQNSPPFSPPIGLAWQWKPQATEGDPQGRQALNTGAICQFYLGSFQELKEAKAEAEKGGLQGRAEKKIFHGKSNCNMKRSKEGVEPGQLTHGVPRPASWAPQRLTTPSLVELLSVAERCQCYSQNMLLREDLIYTNHKKLSCRGVFWLPPWKAQATCLCKDYVGVSFFR